MQNFSGQKFVLASPECDPAEVSRVRASSICRVPDSADSGGHIFHSLQILLLPAGTFLVFVGPCPFLGTAVTRYPVTGDVEGSHLMLILLSWTSVTCIWDGVSISGQQKRGF